MPALPPVSRIALTALVLATSAATATTAIAQAANGTYQIGGCTPGATDTLVSLENNVLSFYEAVCTLANPLPIEGTDGFSYLASCSGEGEDWQANMMLIPMEGGMRLINDGTVSDFARCDG